MTKRILFVDDEIPLRLTLSLYFKMKGIAVVAAENSQDALNLAKAENFSAAIVDINLNGENGMDLLEVLTKEHPTLPVIMFTSLGDDPVLKDTAMSKGARGFMCKREPLDQLHKCVQMAIEGSQPAVC
jgi:DNA-binding NtrC family response regulator